MSKTEPFSHFRLSLFGSAAVACAFSTPVYAQDDTEEFLFAEPEADQAKTEQPEIVITTPRRTLRRVDLLPEARIETVVRHDRACLPGLIDRANPASSLGCAFEDTTLGFKAREQLNLTGAWLGIEASSARSTNGAFALDHARRGFERGMNVETTLSKVVFDANFFDGRIALESSFSWSQEWQSPVANAPILPLRYQERNGSASEHKIKVTLVDKKEFDWSVEGKFTHADEDYRPFNAAVPDRLFAVQGESARIDTRLNFAGWKFGAGLSTQTNDYFESERGSLSVSRSGITARMNLVEGRSDGNFRHFAGFERSTRQHTFGLDVSMFELLPRLAMDEDGWGALLPKTLTFELAERKLEGFDLDQTSSISNSSYSVFGMWVTPLGDTVVNYRSDRESGTTMSGGVHSGARDFLLFSHGVRLGDWRLTADYLTSTDLQGDGLILSNDSGMASMGIGVRYRKKDMPQLDFRLGRDNLDFVAGDGVLSVQDRSLRARMEVDFTPWLQKRLRRDDMNLKLDMLWDFDESGYEFRLFDEVIDRDFSTRSGRGVMLSFTMQLD